MDSPTGGPVIFDAHCHVASADFIPGRFVADVAENMVRRQEAEGIRSRPGQALAALSAGHRDDLADGLVQEMDRAGISRTVLLAPDFGVTDRMRLSLDEMAARHHQIRQRHPSRFWVFIGVDPRRGKEGLDSFGRHVTEYGFEGIKLYPPCGYSPSDERLFPYYEICAERGLPVFVHIGPTAGSYQYDLAHPLQLDRAARLFPAVNFVLGHGGLVHLDVTGYLAAYRRNVYLDIGGFAGTAFPDGWEAHLNRLFRLGLNHKIVFGTDWPLNRLSGGLKRLIDTVTQGPTVFDGVKKREQRLILAGNLTRLLPPGALDAAPGTATEAGAINYMFENEPGVTR